MRSIDGDQSVVRFEKARASMWEQAIRGLWPSAIEEARKVLAQAGGDDDVARMIIATGHIASRRLDAARDACMVWNSRKDMTSQSFLPLFASG